MATDSDLRDASDVIEVIFREYFGEHSKNGHRPDPQPAGLDDQDLLNKMFAARNGGRIRALWDGDTSGYGGDDSAADMALVSHLAFWTGGDDGQMDRLFRTSRLFRQKWDARRGDSTYGVQTIGRALSRVSDHYQRSRSQGGHHDGSVKRESPSPGDSGLIDWPTFWAKNWGSEDFLLEPVLPRGRSIAIYSPAKGGKSLLALDLAVKLAIGDRVLDQPAGEPLSVVYIDLEMTEEDVHERLQDMGYGAETDLSNFHYYLLPTLPRLDTAEGGEAIKEIAARHKASLVIIDTTSRVLGGSENDADTLRAFYLLSGLPLKNAGITVLRLDHSGKDLARGQRGTSAKADDVDLVWELTQQEGGVKLRATHRRQRWIPEAVDLVKVEEPVLRHERAAESWPAGTMALVALLDQLQIPLDWGGKRVRAHLKAAGQGRRGDLVSAAIRYRRRASEEGVPP